MKQLRTILSTSALALLLCHLAAVPAIAAKKEYKPPAGAKIKHQTDATGKPIKVCR